MGIVLLIAIGLLLVVAALVIAFIVRRSRREKYSDSGAEMCYETDAHFASSAFDSDGIDLGNIDSMDRSYTNALSDDPSEAFDFSAEFDPFQTGHEKLSD
jgi:hypothetical protein